MPSIVKQEPVTPAVRTTVEVADQTSLLHRMAALPAGSPERAALREQIIVALLPIGDRIAATHCRGTPWVRDDLRQVADEAIVRTVDRWDPELAQGDFLGYLVPCVRGSILRYFRDQSWSVRVPRRLKEDSARIRQAVPGLTQRLGRSPRPSDLARHLGLELADVLEALLADEARSAAPLDAPPRPDGTAQADTVGESDPRIALVDDVTALGALLASLPERDREIVRLRFFEDRTQSQIAEEIGISQMHVSRLLSRTLRRLRTAMLDDAAEPVAPKATAGRRSA